MINLSELTLDNIGQWPKLFKHGIVLFVFFFVIGAGYWLFIADIFTQYQALQAQELTLKRDFESKQQQAANLQAYRIQMNTMEGRFGTMLKQLPTQNEMPGLLEDISKTGIASGLTFQLFAPLPEVKHDFYIEVPIKIKVSGNYHQLAVFLSRVALLGRIVTLHDLSIKVDTEDVSKNVAIPPDKIHMDLGDKLTMELTAKIYRYRTK